MWDLGRGAKQEDPDADGKSAWSAAWASSGGGSPPSPVCRLRRCRRGADCKGLGGLRASPRHHARRRLPRASRTPRTRPPRRVHVSNGRRHGLSTSMASHVRRASCSLRPVVCPCMTHADRVCGDIIRLHSPQLPPMTAPTLAIFDYGPLQCGGARADLVKRGAPVERYQSMHTGCRGQEHVHVTFSEFTLVDDVCEYAALVDLVGSGRDA